jgi:hypothetical protein
MIVRPRTSTITIRKIGNSGERGRDVAGSAFTVLTMGS